MHTFQFTPVRKYFSTQARVRLMVIIEKSSLNVILQVITRIAKGQNDYKCKIILY